ncbi:MAG: M20/M25/M40 family metallo-hydrolase [Hyphomicrobiales bacterium]
MRRVGLALPLSLAFLSALTALSCGPRPAARWWRDIRWLADDARRGRGTGTPGYLDAARYVARELASAHVKPAGADGYFQPVRFVRRTLRPGSCSLELVRDDGRVDSLTADDAVFVGNVDAPESLEAAAVFVGYGLVVPEYGVDDLAGLDLRGKIAVCVRGGPKDLPDDVRADAMAPPVRWDRLRRAGAIGIAMISSARRPDFRWEDLRVALSGPRFALADTALDEDRGERFSIRINPARGDRFLAGTGHAMAEILDAAERGDPLPRFPLPARIRAHVAADRAIVESPNVVGVIEGSDPALRREAVVVSAHLDHLGVGTPVRGDSIYNGAMDNASGVATLLEIARALGAPGAAPRRSVVFLAVTGEEAGLLGSLAFVERPTLRDLDVVADVNLDMFLPIVPLRSLVDYGGEESELGDWFRAVAESSGYAVAPDPHPRETYFIRSDQYRFVRAGVPSVFVEFGPAGDSTLDAKTTRWERERYHQPSDDTRQPIVWAAADSFNRLFLGFVRDVADRPERPRWKGDSYFRRYARDPRAVAPPGGGASGTASRPPG